MAVVCMEATSERVQVSGRKPASLYMDLSDAVARVQSRRSKSEGRQVTPYTVTFHGGEAFQVIKHNKAI